MKICVYCASSATVDKSYFDVTERLAKEFLKEKIDVVCGGGAVGLMGQLADTMLAGGVIPAIRASVAWNKDAINFAVNRG